MPGGCAKADARQNRKRAIASVPGGDEASSPTKRRRLGLSDGESDIVNERAKITEPARTDFPAAAESDGTDCSRFRYYGALASTTVSFDRWSRRRTLPTHSHLRRTTTHIRSHQSHLEVSGQFVLRVCHHAYWLAMSRRRAIFNVAKSRRHSRRRCHLR